MPVDHYENFPVASFLLPAALRSPVETIYRFARTADDFADEGDFPASERLNRLKHYDDQLLCLIAGQPPRPSPDSELFLALREVHAAHGVDYQLLRDLLSAFMQDVCKTRYASWTALFDYCRRSANPIGRLMLQLYGRDTEHNRLRSDGICTALQLANFWQDVSVDWKKGRVYLPAEILTPHGIDADLLAGCDQRQLAKAVREAIARTRELLLTNAPLVHDLPGRIGLELRLVVQGGRRILERTDACAEHILLRRPALGPADWCRIALRSLTMRA